MISPNLHGYRIRFRRKEIQYAGTLLLADFDIRINFVILVGPGSTEIKKGTCKTVLVQNAQTILANLVRRKISVILHAGIMIFNDTAHGNTGHAVLIAMCVSADTVNGNTEGPKILYREFDDLPDFQIVLSKGAAAKKKKRKNEDQKMKRLLTYYLKEYLDSLTEFLL